MRTFGFELPVSLFFVLIIIIVVVIVSTTFVTLLAVLRPRKLSSGLDRILDVLLSLQFLLLGSLARDIGLVFRLSLV